VSRLLKRRSDTVSEKRALWRDASNALTLGWNLAIPIFGGVLIGYLLDKWMKSSPIFTIGLMIFGIAVGFYNYIRTVGRMEDPNQPKNEPRSGGKPK
jgi:ATP synthase protein I